jgi:hypothetical protein
VETDLLKALSDYGIETNSALTDMYRSFQSGREYTRTLGAYPEQSGRLYEPDISDPNCYSGSLLSDAEAFSESTEMYRKCLASIDRRLAQICDTVIEVSAGQSIVYKGEIRI